jgi:hypothetical protein
MTASRRVRGRETSRGPEKAGSRRLEFIDLFPRNSFLYVGRSAERGPEPLCFQLLGAVPQPQLEQQALAAKEPRPLWRCPKCGGPMVVLERLSAAQIQLRSPPFRTGAAA